MIIPDVNLLVYAYNADAPGHEKARRWWEDLLSGDQPIGLPWAVTCGFVRLMTHPAVLLEPLDTRRALEHVRSWLSLAGVEVLDPGPRHIELFERALREAGVGGNLVTDAHLAAIAIDYQAEIHSNDADFARFSGLRWRNPLQTEG